jgi:hypothetical protein
MTRSCSIDCWTASRRHCHRSSHASPLAANNAPRKRLNTGDSATEDQGVHVVGAFVFTVSRARIFPRPSDGRRAKSLAGRARHPSMSASFFCTSCVAAGGRLNCLRSSVYCRARKKQSSVSRPKTQRRIVARLQTRMITARHGNDLAGDE